MAKNPENKIKGSIGEVIAEQLFKDLGFFVMKLGKEHTVNPLDQLQDFTDACGGNFQLEKLDHKIKEISHINVLPDFVIVHPKGKVCLLEVKFRRDAMLVKKWGDYLVFNTYPEAHMLIINVDVSEDLDKVEGVQEEDFKNLRKTRFHIWTRLEDPRDKNKPATLKTLKEWLKDDFNIKNDDLVDWYGALVEKWLKEN